MRILKYQLKFNTPAFLGDAEQNGRWRTPPIKALLRQWWRVVWAADHGYRVDVDDMRREEGRLFGMANDGDGDSHKSVVRIRLDKWDEGKLTKKDWGRQEIDKRREGIQHPEVGYIGPKLYLGYGPLVVEKIEQRGQRPQYATTLKANAAIQAGEAATLSIAFPEEQTSRLERTLWLMDRYGTLGGRSRNGWGSFALLPQPSGEDWGEGDSGVRKLPLRDWQECLDLDWPHAIGKDQKGALIWQTAPHNDWMALMKTLAVIKIGLRTQKREFKFTMDTNAGDKSTNKNKGINHGRPQARHWLSYPVTNHLVQPWEVESVNNKKKPLKLRLPNQLRFKVRPTPDNKLVGVIFHVPHLPPAAFRPDRPVIEKVWKLVHAFLDDPAQHLTRIPE